MVALRAVRARSAWLVATAVMTKEEREDLEQEIAFYLFRVLIYYDPSKGSLQTFVEVIVRHRIISTLRWRRRQPLLEPLRGDDVVGAPEHIVSELRVDVDRVVARLAEPEQRLAKLLSKYLPTEASRMLAISRSSVYEAMRRIRATFRHAGLQPGHPTSSPTRFRAG